MTNGKLPQLIIQLENSDVLGYSGRIAWALRALIAAGERGCTPIDTPGPRWSAYVHELRGDGIDIETIHERHAGPYPGRHARYVLRSQLTIQRREAA